MVKSIIYFYLIAEKDSDKKQLAYDIYRCSLNVKLKGLGKLLDIKQLNEYAKIKAHDIQKTTKKKQERRHDKRKDFSLTDDEWKYVNEYFNYRCAYCGKKDRLTYEHFIPFSKGGEFTRFNIVPVCKCCNSSKRDRNFREWYSKQEFYSREREEKIYDYFRMMGMS